MEKPSFLLHLLVLYLLVVIGEGTLCPSGWIDNTSHRSCIKPYDSHKTWFEARDACSQEHATLIHVDSDDFRTFLAVAIEDSGVLRSGEEYWIASNDIQQEDSLRSVFGQSLSYTSWANNQPNDRIQDGGPHTQNCVIDVVSSSLMKQEDKACTERHTYVCEMWLSQLDRAVFTLTYSDNALQNHGVAPDAADDFSAVTAIVCASACMQRYYYCDMFVFSDRLQRCKLLRLYEKDRSSNALSEEDVKRLQQEGYKAFVLDISV